MSRTGNGRSAAAMLIVAGGLAVALPPTVASAGQACIRSKRYGQVGPTRQGIPSDPCIMPKDRGNRASFPPATMQRGYRTTR